MLRATGSSGGIPAFHVHPGHTFEGFELVERPAGTPMLVARCHCGEVLDVAEARFAACPACAGTACVRCGGTGRIVDHSALEWRLPDQNVP
jgi:hypothetical protein